MTATDARSRRDLRAAAAESLRHGLIALIAFLTLVDLFAAQAILPSLVREFGVSRAAMGFAVNTSTFGMAIAGIIVALFGQRVDRRAGICLSLALLSVPTTLLAFTHNLTLFTLLRVVQGLFMSTAFTLTAAWLSENLGPTRTGGALAAYVTGNVASNFFGRLMSASLADTFGLEACFLTFAALNLVGAAVVLLAFKRGEAMLPAAVPSMLDMRGWTSHLRHRDLRHSFAIGFLILFAFIGTYTYVNFRLVEEPISLSPMALGLVYFVFLPAMLTTPFGGRIGARLGPARGIGLTLLLAIAGLAALLSISLPVVMAGLAAVAVGTFLAQAIATAHVGRVASLDRAAASGIYLAAYYSGGLVGSFVLGQVFDHLGWGATVALLVAALAAAIALASPLRRPSGP